VIFVLEKGFCPATLRSQIRGMMRLTPASVALTIKSSARAPLGQAVASVIGMRFDLGIGASPKSSKSPVFALLARMAPPFGRISKISVSALIRRAAKCLSRDFGGVHLPSREGGSSVRKKNRTLKDYLSVRGLLECVRNLLLYSR